MVKKIISFTAAAKCCIMVYSVFVLFHVMVILMVGIFRTVPLDLIWYNDLRTYPPLFIFEISAVVVLLGCLFLTLVHAQFVSVQRLRKIAHICMWIFAVYFFLNTIANLYGETLIEKSFILGSIPLSFCSLRLALERTVSSRVGDSI